MNMQYCACRADALRIFVRSLTAPSPPQWRQFSGLAGRQSRSSGLLPSSSRRMEAVASLLANGNMQASGVRYYARGSSKRVDPEPMLTSTDAFLDAMEGRTPPKTSGGGRGSWNMNNKQNRKNNRSDKQGGRPNRWGRSDKPRGMKEQKARDFPVVTLAPLASEKAPEPRAKKAPEPPVKTLPPLTFEKGFTDQGDRRDDARQKPWSAEKKEPTQLNFEKFDEFDKSEKSEKPEKLDVFDKFEKLTLESEKVEEPKKPNQVEKPGEKVVVKKRGPWVEDPWTEDKEWERFDARSALSEADQPPRTQSPPQSGSQPMARARTPAPSPLKPPPRPPMQRPPPDAEQWKIQKYALQQKFPEGWNPRKKLSPDAHDGIRALNKQFPETYTTEALAEHFKVSPEAIRRILKSRWRPSPEEEEGRQQRWFERGKQVWSRWAELGRKPPKRWQAEGIRRDASWAGKRQRQQEWRAQMVDAEGAEGAEGTEPGQSESTKTQSQGKRMRLQLQGLDRGAEESA